MSQDSVKSLTYMPDRSKPLDRKRFARRRNTLRPITFTANWENDISPVKGSQTQTNKSSVAEESSYDFGPLHSTAYTNGTPHSRLGSQLPSEIIADPTENLEAIVEQSHDQKEIRLTPRVKQKLSTVSTVKKRTLGLKPNNSITANTSHEDNIENDDISHSITERNKSSKISNPNTSKSFRVRSEEEEHPPKKRKKASVPDYDIALEEEERVTSTTTTTTTTTKSHAQSQLTTTYDIPLNDGERAATTTHSKSRTTYDNTVNARERAAPITTTQSKSRTESRATPTYHIPLKDGERSTPSKSRTKSHPSSKSVVKETNKTSDLRRSHKCASVREERDKSRRASISNNNTRTEDAEIPVFDEPQELSHRTEKRPEKRQKVCKASVQEEIKTHIVQDTIRSESHSVLEVRETSMKKVSHKSKDRSISSTTTSKPTKPTGDSNNSLKSKKSVSVKSRSSNNSEISQDDEQSFSKRTDSNRSQGSQNQDRLSSKSVGSSRSQESDGNEQSGNVYSNKSSRDSSHSNVSHNKDRLSSKSVGSRRSQESHSSNEQSQGKVESRSSRESNNHSQVSNDKDRLSSKSVGSSRSQDSRSNDEQSERTVDPSKSSRESNNHSQSSKNKDRLSSKRVGSSRSQESHSSNEQSERTVNSSKSSRESNNSETDSSSKNRISSSTSERTKKSVPNLSGNLKNKATTIHKTKRTDSNISQTAQVNELSKNRVDSSRSSAQSHNEPESSISTVVPSNSYNKSGKEKAPKVNKLSKHRRSEQPQRAEPEPSTSAGPSRSFVNKHGWKSRPSDTSSRRSSNTSVGGKKSNQRGIAEAFAAVPTKRKTVQEVEAEFVLKKRPTTKKNQPPAKQRHLSTKSTVEASYIMTPHRTAVKPKTTVRRAPVEKRPVTHLPPAEGRKVRLWCTEGVTRKAAQTTDLDIVLNTFEDIAWDLRCEHEENRLLKKVVTRAAKAVITELRQMLSATLKTKELGTAVKRSRATLQRKRADLSVVQRNHQSLRTEFYHRQQSESSSQPKSS